MPRPPLEPSAAYEHAHSIAQDLLADIRQQLDAMLKPDDVHLRWRHVHAFNQINARLSEVATMIDEVNNRSR